MYLYLFIFIYIFKFNVYMLLNLFLLSLLLEKAFQWVAYATDLTNFIKNSFEFLIKFQIC